MKKRTLLHSALAGAALVLAGPAFAQTTPIKFQFDWRFEGPAALFLTPAAKGYFKDAKLDVTIDVGSGSGGTVTRVASGAYDMGFADMAALMEFHGNNPDAPNKPVAVMMVYADTPASVVVLKRSGIKTPADLSGKKIGAPVFDAGRRAFPVFAKANGISGVQWTSMEPSLRETMLVRGDVDAITGFNYTALLNLEARGTPAAEVLVMPYPQFGVKFYGNAIIASPKLIKENPAAVKAFLQAFTRGVREVIARPMVGIDNLKARDGLVNAALELRRLNMTIDTAINTPNARAEGFGQTTAPRLSLMASQVSDAFTTKTRVNPDAVWNGSFLPSATELNLLPGKK